MEAYVDKYRFYMANGKCLDRFAVEVQITEASKGYDLVIVIPFNNLGAAKLLLKELRENGKDM